MTAPETLADVKVGDEVLLVPRLPTETCRSVTVDRVTKTMICIGSTKFKRSNGQELVDRGWDWIEVGQQAETAKKERDENIKRINGGRAWRLIKSFDYFSQENVMTVRVACANAEAILRELGEWRDETACLEGRGNPL